jgi:hypothetical protein
VISGFRREADEICALLGYYAALSGIYVPTFRDNLLVTSSKIKKSLQTNPGQTLKQTMIVSLHTFYINSLHHFSI